MPKKFRSKGFFVEVSEGFFDPDDGSFGTTKFASRPNSRAAWAASISNRWYHVKSLFPFDSEEAATKAAKKWTSQHAEHPVFR